MLNVTATTLQTKKQPAFLAYGMAIALQTVPTVIVDTLVNPIDRVIILKQTAPMRETTNSYLQMYLNNESTASILERTTEEEGFEGHYRGATIGIVRTLTVNAVYAQITPDLLQTIKSFLPPAHISKTTTITRICLEVISSVLSFPFDVVKTRYTSDISPVGLHETREYTNGILDCAEKIYEREGVSAFFSGLGVSMVSQISSNFSLSYLSSRFKYQVRSDSWIDPWVSLSVDLLVRTGVVALFYPLESIKRRMMVNGAKGYKEQGVYTNSFECAKRMVAEEGVKSLYRGVDAAVLRIIPRTICAKFIFDAMKYQLNILTASIQQQ